LPKLQAIPLLTYSTSPAHVGMHIVCLFVCLFVVLFFITALYLTAIWPPGRKDVNKLTDWYGNLEWCGYPMVKKV